MAQLFRPRANSIARLTVAGVPLLAVGTSAIVYGFARSDFWTEVKVPQQQPVPFSHQHHAGGLGIDCRYCHTTVEESGFAGLPPIETCMTCHSQVWKDAPVLQPVRESWQTGKPIKWRRVYDLPGYVYFDHSIHVAKGVGCATCHGRVNQMPLTWKTQELYMRWCLDCHRDPAKNLRPIDQVVSMNYRQPVDQGAVGRKLLQENHVHTSGLTDCYTCHR
jgi:hypothetical protein